ncbi:hypothetical protein Tco_0662640 [Tanacetum coccineum]
METKNTSSSGSVLEEPEIQKLQMQAKIFKENSLNKLNALKSTTQLLERQTFSGCILYQQAFAQLFGDSVRTFKFQLSQHMNNLETQLNAETLHEMDSKSALSVIKAQFERFINSDLLKPLDFYSRSFSSDREVRENFRDYTKMTAHSFKETIIQNMNSIEQCIIERASHEQELKMTLKKLSERQLQIQQCKVQEIQSSVTGFSAMKQAFGIVQLKRLINRNWKHITVYMDRYRSLHLKNPVLLVKPLNRTIIEIKEGLSQREPQRSFRIKVKEEKDIDKMIEMDKQLKFLNEIVYTRNQSIQTIHMLAPKCATYNGRQPLPFPRFAPDREETMTLDNESRSKLDKDTVKPYDYTGQKS